jgi:hypothetical protein
METDNKNESEKNKDNTPEKAGSFDLNTFLTNPDLVGLLKHLLTGAGALAGNYLLWIKPLQEKMEAMNEKITQQEQSIKELEAKVATNHSNDSQKSEPLLEKENEYFKVDRNKLHEHNKYRRIKF